MKSKKIFLSSSIYGLIDLRAVLKEKIENEHFEALLSEYPGFEHEFGVPPYSACLPNIDESVIVIAVIDQWYGEPKKDWGAAYNEICGGLSPVHGELMYTLTRYPEKLWLFVRRRVKNFYYFWKNNLDSFNSESSPVDLQVLRMLDWLYNIESHPWISDFDNVLDVSREIEYKLFNITLNALNDHLLTKPTSAISQINEQIIKAGANLDCYINFISPESINVLYSDGTDINIYSGGTVLFHKHGTTDYVVDAVVSISGSSSLNIRGEVKKKPDDQ